MAIHRFIDTVKHYINLQKYNIFFLLCNFLTTFLDSKL